MMNNRRDIVQALLLALSVFFAIILIFIFFHQYRDARNELSVLKSDLAKSTAVWKQINEEKLIVQRELKEAKSSLREANLTIEESEEKVKDIEEEIAVLEKEIKVLKTGNP